MKKNVFNNIQFMDARFKDTKMNINTTIENPFYTPTKIELQLLSAKIPYNLKMDSDLFLGYVEIKYESEYSIWKILTAVGITVTGCISFFIPGVGFIIGSSLTSAGIAGLIQSIKNPGIDQNQFFKQMGIQALVGLTTSVISKLGKGIKILSDTMFKCAIKGAILGALTGTAAQLIKIGINPSKDFDWSNVLIQAVISAIVCMHKFKNKNQLNQNIEKKKFWKQLQEKLSDHWQQKKECMKILDQRWNVAYYKLSAQQQRMFPQMLSQNFTKNHNQGLVHFLDYNAVASLAQKKGRLPLIAEILGAKVSPNKGFIPGFLPEITRKMDELVMGKIDPSSITVIGENGLKQIIINNNQVDYFVNQLINKGKAPWGIARVYNYLPQVGNKGLQLTTYTDLRTNIQKFSTVFPKQKTRILKELSKLCKK